MSDKQLKSNMSSVPIWKKMNLTVEEASEYSGIGTSKIKELFEMSRNVQSGNTQNLKSSAAPVRLPAAPAPTPGTSQAAAPAGCAYRS